MFVQVISTPNVIRDVNFLTRIQFQSNLLSFHHNHKAYERSKNKRISYIFSTNYTSLYRLISSAYCPLKSHQLGTLFHRHTKYTNNKFAWDKKSTKNSLRDRNQPVNFVSTVFSGEVSINKYRKKFYITQYAQKLATHNEKTRTRVYIKDITCFSA